MIHRILRNDILLIRPTGLLFCLLALASVIPCADSAVAQVDTARVTVRFTAPGDDGQVGRAAAYDIRYSSSPINQGNWNQATPVTGTIPPPNVSGTNESIRVGIPNALLGNTYHMALRARDEASNWSPVSNSASFVYTIGSGTGDDPVILPDQIILRPNFPNPFNPSTRIEFQVPTPAIVKITIWNAAGQRVRDLVETGFAAGSHEVLWDGTNYLGRAVPSGTYFYQLTSGNFSTSRKMTLLK